MKSFIGAIIFIFSSTALATKVDLDSILQKLAEDQSHTPFVIGPRQSQAHPQYFELSELAKVLGGKIIWTKSVSAYVLNLPPNPERMKVNPNDEFDGWFDEYTIPQQVIVHQKASFIILIHELRHLLHLGNHEQIYGNSFDRLLQRKKRKLLALHSRILSSELPPIEKRKLKRAATRLVETCSEISAHQGDYFLALAFQREEASAYAKFINDYKREFQRSYDLLIKYPEIVEMDFTSELYIGLEEFLAKKGLSPL